MSETTKTETNSVTTTLTKCEDYQKHSRTGWGSTRFYYNQTDVEKVKLWFDQHPGEIVKAFGTWYGSTSHNLHDIHRELPDAYHFLNWLERIMRTGNA